ncbi:MAG: hypothetical protein PHG67_06020 [Bacteroidales bacterium]|jgi:hypothetical protein|nr:hypothetical protein [Bacteroidales bacterium]HOI31197.1 hypothetical protein [Bacteroidales bacterium]
MDDQLKQLMQRAEAEKAAAMRGDFEQHMRKRNHLLLQINNLKQRQKQDKKQAVHDYNISFTKTINYE